MDLILQAMYQKVRDLLGVSVTALPDSVIDGYPQDMVKAHADRRVPNWAALTAPQRTDFDIAVVFDLAAESIRGLETKHASGESASDAKAGNYDWVNRLTEYANIAKAYFNRAAVQAGLSEPSYTPLRIGGGSRRREGYVSPDTFLNVPVINR